MQPVLVDGGELVPQRLVEIFDDLGIALHDALPMSSRASASRHYIRLILNYADRFQEWREFGGIHRRLPE